MPDDPVRRERPLEPGTRARRAVLAAATAAVLTAVTAGCGTVGAHDGSPPSAPGGTAGTTGGQGSAPSPVPVPTAALRAALGCPSGVAVSVDHRVDVPTTHPGAVVAAHCASAAGSPPSGVYVLADQHSGGSRIAATLVPTHDDVQVRQLTGTGRTVRLQGMGYSAPTVPRCCPDRTVSRAWSVEGDTLVPVG